jgi:cephalosporin-C deacetylase-like acetyl esterase
MAHGFGGQREMRLPAFAEHFAARGLAVPVFDYRCFGASDGMPRNWIDPRRHLADCHAAIEHARSLRDVDGSRLGLWGTSFSGGHVLATAAALTSRSSRFPSWSWPACSAIPPKGPGIPPSTP